MPDVGDWLKTLDLEQYAQLFAENGIDPSVLPDLADQDLEKLGVLLGHCRKMLRWIAQLPAEDLSVGSKPAYGSGCRDGNRRCALRFVTASGHRQEKRQVTVAQKTRGSPKRAATQPAVPTGQ
jgi:hypothetical protein